MNASLIQLNTLHKNRLSRATAFAGTLCFAS